MVLGYSIIAVPTGIVTVEFGRVREDSAGRRTCPACGRTGHDRDAAFCKICGARLP
jgi:voltage-gated potassium channel